MSVLSCTCALSSVSQPHHNPSLLRTCQLSAHLPPAWPTHPGPPTTPRPHPSHSPWNPPHGNRAAPSSTLTRYSSFLPSCSVLTPRRAKSCRMRMQLDQRGEGTAEPTYPTPAPNMYSQPCHPPFISPLEVRLRHHPGSHQPRGKYSPPRPVLLGGLSTGISRLPRKQAKISPSEHFMCE